MSARVSHQVVVIGDHSDLWRVFIRRKVEYMAFASPAKSHDTLWSMLLTGIKSFFARLYLSKAVALCSSVTKNKQALEASRDGHNYLAFTCQDVIAVHQRQWVVSAWC